jgi:hypothetical protein
VRVQPYADLRRMDFVQVVTSGASGPVAGVAHP